MSTSNIYRDVTLDKISEQDVGKTLRAAGWVENIRDHGGVSFIDLRDMYGVLQVVMRDTSLLEGINKEDCISVEGVMEHRDEETYNPKIPTGTIELEAHKVDMLGKVYKPLPFEIVTSKENHENTRLKYRYLDLRNRKVKDNMIFRSKVISYLREKMTEMGFLEIQTPILCASSPEGARDYIVPSRKFKGKFYALPQAPQQYKQLLMVSGFDKYFQIAPCFRDEDARADRSPGEFYQLDFEMSFATQEDVFRVGEEVLADTFKKFAPEGYAVTEAPFPVISYAEAMLSFGTDKPDLRNPLRIIDVTEFFQRCSFKPFHGQTVRAIKVSEKMSKGFHEKLLKFAQSIGMGGLGYLEVLEDGSYKGPIDKFIPEDMKKEMAELGGLVPGDTIFFIADKEKQASLYAGQIRTELGERLDLLEKNASMTSRCMNTMKSRRKSSSPTTRFPCRRAAWKRSTQRIRWIFWHISMILSATVWNYPPELCGIIIWILWSKPLRLPAIRKKICRPNSEHCTMRSSTEPRRMRVWRRAWTA